MGTLKFEGPSFKMGLLEYINKSMPLCVKQFLQSNL